MTSEVRPGRFSEPLPHEVPESFELVRVRIPMHEPFVAAHGTEHERDLVLVRAVAADGLEGWGECSTLSSPGYTSEHTAAAWSAMVDDLAPAIVEGRPSTAARSNPMAAAGLEVACVDLALRRVDRSLTVEFGPAVERVPVGVVVGAQPSIDELLAAVERRLAEGYAQVKLKVTPDWFLEPLRVVRDAWPDVSLAADANGSLRTWWDDDRDAARLDALDALALDYLEQPLPPGDFEDYAPMIRALDTAIALDESVTDLSSFVHALDHLGLDRPVVNVKPARLGGLCATRELLHVLDEHGCSAFVGGMLESGIGRATALAVATSPICNRVGDLGPSDRYFPRDVITEPFVMTNGTLQVPTGRGLGVDVDLDAVEAFAVDRVTITRS